MYLVIKRFFDFIFSALVLVVLSPFLIPISIGLKLTGEGFIFYFQERIGYKNKLFDIWKFATMLKNSPQMKGGAITLKNDPRITPLGGFLRKWKINEVPQLLNILKGDMSIVGPRPLMKEQSFDFYPEDVKKVIYNTRPGLTGIGSIVFRDEEELLTDHVKAGGDAKDLYANTIYPYKGQIEKWYQQNIGFFTDLKIIWLTIWVIVFPESKLIFSWFPTLPEAPKPPKIIGEEPSDGLAESFTIERVRPMVDNPKISMITVTWNSAETIEQAIQSIKNQTYKNIELIIVDGASTDNTLEVIKKQGSIVSKLISEKDYGIYDGMNKGLSMVTGDIVGFLNSDDFLAHDKVLENVVNTMVEQDVDSIYGDLKYVSQNDHTQTTRYWVARPYDEKRFLYGWMPPHPTFYVRSYAYKYFGDFDLSLRNSADYELMLRFLYKHKLSTCYINDVMVYMREGGASNFSIQARINANIEDRRAWKKNGLKPRFYTSILKPIRKVKQFMNR